MVTIKVKVHPSAREEKIKRGDVWEIWVKAPPVKGKANEEVVRILRRFFRRVKLVRGQKSRLKIFEVEE